MEYNSQREKLIIPEYGRNVQKMVEYAISIEDREKRTNAAKYIVSVMASMNPQNRDSSDYMRTLWDHLYIISDFRLEHLPVMRAFNPFPKQKEFPVINGQKSQKHLYKSGFPGSVGSQQAQYFASI